MGLKKRYIAICLILLFLLVGCVAAGDNAASDDVVKASDDNATISVENNVVEEQQVVEIPDTTNKISLKEIPEYSDMPYVEINNNTPFFYFLELTTTAFENYSDLDNLGRVGIAYACIEKGMDDQPRESISKITILKRSSSKLVNLSFSSSELEVDMSSCLGLMILDLGL